MTSRCLILVLLAGVLAPCCAAQMHGGGPGFGGSRSFPGHHHQAFGGNAVFLGDPFLYADYQPLPVAYAPPPAPVVIVQPTPPAVAAPERKAEPLLIEWQGDRYVRFSGDKDADARPDYAQRGSTADKSSSASAAAVTSGKLLPVMLIYRDGHHEEVSDYAIVNGVLYARGDYWRDGYWTKNIRLAALDIPGTLIANQQNGTKFVLPSGPNEVVTRP